MVHYDTLQSILQRQHQQTVVIQQQVPHHSSLCKHQSLITYWCLFVSKKTPKDAVTPERSIVQVYSVCWQWPLTRTMSTIELCGVTASFGIFLETNQHQNLMRLQCPITWQLEEVDLWTTTCHQLISGSKYKQLFHWSFICFMWKLTEMVTNLEEVVHAKSFKYPLNIILHLA